MPHEDLPVPDRIPEAIVIGVCLLLAVVVILVCLVLAGGGD